MEEKNSPREKSSKMSFFKKIKLPQLNAKKFAKWVFLGTFILLLAWFVAQYFTYKIYRVMVSNVSSRSATISWVTEDAEPGVVVYKEGKFILPIRLTTFNADLAVDDRDYSAAELNAAIQTTENLSQAEEITSDEIVSELTISELGNYWTHHVTIRNLEPETEYEFMVGNGNYFESVKSVNTESSTFTTKEELEEIAQPDPAYGIIRYYDNNDQLYVNSFDAVVYATIYERLRDIESEVISGTTNLDGGWYLDLSNAVTQSGDNYLESLNDYGEATEIYVRLTFENAWFGRWTKEIIYPEEIAPADTIDLNPVEGSFGNLIFEGYSFGNIEDNSSFLSRIFAYDPDGIPSRTTTNTTTLQVNAGLLARSAGYAAQAARYLESQAAKETGAKKVELQKQAEKFANESQDLANAVVAVKKQGGSSGSVSEVTYNKIMKETADSREKLTKSFQDNDDHGNPVVQADTDGDGKISEKERLAALGACPNDKCGGEVVTMAKVQCGYVTNASCNCSCKDGSITIKKGQFCSCEGGKPVKSGIEYQSLQDKEGVKTSVICTGDNSGKTVGTCYSSSGKCYYGEGYKATTGETCMKGGDNQARWGNPDDIYSEFGKNGAKGVCCSKSGWNSAFESCFSGSELGGAVDSSQCDVLRSTKRYMCCDGEWKYVNPGSCLSVNEKATSSTCSSSSTSKKCYISYKMSGTQCKIHKDYSASFGSVESTDCTDMRPREVSKTECEAAEKSRLSELYKNITVDTPCNDYPTSKLVESINGKVYKCDNGSYILADSYQIKNDTQAEIYGLKVGQWLTIQENKPCPWWWDHSYDEEGKKLECDGGKWVINDSKSSKSSISYAEVYSSDIAGQFQGMKSICPDDIIKCQCTYKNEAGFLRKELINSGETCGSGSSGAYNIGKVGSVFAMESGNNDYVLDTKTGLIQGFNPGVYTYEIDGESYIFKIENEDLADNPDGVEIYADVNSNGIFDEGTDVKVTDEATVLSIEPIIEGFVYSLSSGYNFVSFPFVFDEISISMASDLLDYLNAQYDESFYSIAKFDSGRWKVVGSNGVDYDQNDFQIIPGEGYLLKAKWDLDVTIYGKEVKFESSSDNAPIRFIPGWNLVGLYGSGVKSYTAQSLLEDVTNYKEVDFTAVNVSRWVEERSLYEGLQREANDEGMMQIYGLDFPLYKQKGYFVKVTEGSGNWEPETK